MKTVILDNEKFNSVASAFESTDDCVAQMNDSIQTWAAEKKQYTDQDDPEINHPLNQFVENITNELRNALISVENKTINGKNILVDDDDNCYSDDDFPRFLGKLSDLSEDEKKMNTNKSITTEVKSILASKHYSVQCQYSGAHVPDAELDRANRHGEDQLKSVSDADVLDAINYCRECGSEDDSIVAHVLGRIAEKDFSTPYDNISFVVNIW